MGLLDGLSGALLGDASTINQHANARSLANNVLGSLSAPGLRTATNTSLARILELLTQPGKLDERARMREQRAVGRGVTGAQQQAQRNFARRGLANSGLSDAIQAALGMAGANKQAEIEAKHARFQDQLKRSDVQQGIQSILGLFVNPGLNAFGVERGVDVQNAQIEQAHKNAFLQLLGAGVTAAGAAI